MNGKKDGFLSGLQILVFFILALALLGYDIQFSLLFGGIGALAGGLIVDWWQHPDKPRDSQPQQAEYSEELSSDLTGIRLAVQERNAREKRRSEGSLNPISRFFRR
ncbi:hypothetical protein [Moorena sp. SIO4G3]|uniref:hypothetical protein n=1 Tax=Moorena sp. SIO4G3 TaxID=2607821 RepID=UPI00142937D0|nr:hypothetical protein [Moorena sp. SIO4G3]NEO74908.1 hypothetical protein [Moorena sp. SIO4G3]